MHVVLEFKSWFPYLSLCDDAGQAKILRRQSEKHISNTTSGAHPCATCKGDHTVSATLTGYGICMWTWNCEGIDQDPDTLDVFFPKAKAISFSWFWSMGAWAEMARELRDSKREVVKTDHRRVLPSLSLLPSLRNSLGKTTRVH